MKISNSAPNYINQTYANQSKSAANQDARFIKPGDETQTDSINLSNRTKDLQKISKAMETEPVGRDKLVADIKQQVETNQYDVNATLIAEKMVGSIMGDIVG